MPSRTRQNRDLEDEDENSAIVRGLESEPWIPDAALDPPVITTVVAASTTTTTTCAANVSAVPFPDVSLLETIGTNPNLAAIPIFVDSPTLAKPITSTPDQTPVISKDHATFASDTQAYLAHSRPDQQQQQQQQPDFNFPELQYELPTRPQNARQEQAAPAQSTSGEMTDNEAVIDSLQSLKSLAMLALDGLLQQVVSDVTASDPIHSPDETTLHARALMRRASRSMLTLEELIRQDDSIPGATFFSDSDLALGSVQVQAKAKSPIRTVYALGLNAASSLERLDELSRKVDQLTVAASVNEASSSSSSAVERVPEPGTARPTLLQSAYAKMESSQVFESQEYHLACALAALLACIYRILNQMQGPRIPQRTESADSGLDQASKLWKRLSSNVFSKSPRGSLHLERQSMSCVGAEAETDSVDAAWQSGGRSSTESAPPIPQKRATMSAWESGTNGFIQSINRQVRTLKSRRTQSTSHIEIPSRRTSTRRGSPFGKNHSTNLRPEDAYIPEKEQELEQEWAELDKLMDEMSQLWSMTAESAIEQQEQDQSRNPFDDQNHSSTERTQQQALSSVTLTSNTGGLSFDQQTLDMPDAEELPKYEDSPQYRPLEKKQDLPSQRPERLTRIESRGGMAGLSGIDDEKTRFDLNNVMSAIERLSRVAPRLDNQRVQLSVSQKKQMAQATVAHTIDRLSRGRWEDQRAPAPSSSSLRRNMQVGPTSTLTAMTAASTTSLSERSQDLNKLIHQIVESAKAGYHSQRAEFSPRQQQKLEGARIGEKVERGERLRFSDQDYQTPESVLLKDMTRLTNTLYQQTATTQAYATQRYTLSEDKARSIALHGIISKIEKLSDRRLDNQDATPRSSSSLNRPKSMVETRQVSLDALGSRSATAAGSSTSLGTANSKAQELQDMINRVVDGGGGPMRKQAMATQRAEFSVKPK
ncbi:hypothetical protein BGW38_002709 [Lunasporangiospora selenospora]|uniref:Uncharacterized protein n=1 Tax=Lunasporangiospora selenospora TaxID=979761 RepID=A0A9P6FRY9_9FUNG|nr:hypothetical protein BGW38_002709 [Lunasporangiospora selenospora]